MPSPAAYFGIPSRPVADYVGSSSPFASVFAGYDPVAQQEGQQQAADYGDLMAGNTDLNSDEGMSGLQRLLLSGRVSPQQARAAIYGQRYLNPTQRATAAARAGRYDPYSPETADAIASIETVNPLDPKASETLAALAEKHRAAFVDPRVSTPFHQKMGEILNRANQQNQQFYGAQNFANQPEAFDFYQDQLNQPNATPQQAYKNTRQFQQNKQAKNSLYDANVPDEDVALFQDEKGNLDSDLVSRYNRLYQKENQSPLQGNPTRAKIADGVLGAAQAALADSLNASSKPADRAEAAQRLPGLALQMKSMGFGPDDIFGATGIKQPSQVSAFLDTLRQKKGVKAPPVVAQPPPAAPATTQSLADIVAADLKAKQDEKNRPEMEAWTSGKDALEGQLRKSGLTDDQLLQAYRSIYRGEQIPTENSSFGLPGSNIRPDEWLLEKAGISPELVPGIPGKGVYGNAFTLPSGGRVTYPEAIKALAEDRLKQAGEITPSGRTAPVSNKPPVGTPVTPRPGVTVIRNS